MTLLLLALQAIPEIEYEDAFPKVRIARVVARPSRSESGSVIDR